MATTRAGSGQIQPNIKLEGNEGIVIPVGTTAQRNPNPVEGEIRFNTDLNTFEGYTGQVWGGMGPFPFVKSEYFEGDGSTFSFALEQQVANPDDLTVLLNGVQLRPGIDFQLVGQRNIVFEEDDGSVRPPDSGSTVSIRYFVPITSASVIANSISIEELAVVPGTPGEFLTLDQNQALLFTNVLPDNSVGTEQLIFTGSAGLDGQALLKDGNGFAFGEISDIAENSISIRELDVSDGQIGQVLATDGQGNLAFITIEGGSGGGGSATNFFDLSGQLGYGQIPNNIIDINKLDVSDGTAGQVLATDGLGNLQFVDGASSSDIINDITPQLGGDLDLNNNNITGEGNLVLDAGNDLSPNNRTGKVYFSNVFSTVGDLPNASTYQGMFAYVNATQEAYYSRNGAWARIVDIENDTLQNIQSTSDVPEGVNLYYTAQRFDSRLGTKSIDALSDVDTTSIVPLIGQSLVWNGTQWRPQTVSGDGGNSNLFNTIAVSGQSDITADSTTDTLTFAAGSGISLATNATTDTITITNSDPNVDQNIFRTISADSGSLTATSPTTNLTISGGTGISTSLVGNNLAIEYTGNTGLDNAFAELTVAGQSTITASGSDTINFVAGANVTITTNPGTNSIQIDAAGSSGGGGVAAGTANQLGYYATTSSTISPTGAGLTWNGTTLNVNALAVANGINSFTTQNITASGTISADTIESTGTGVPTFTSGSDIEFDAASGAGEIRFTGDAVVTGLISATSSITGNSVVAPTITTNTIGTSGNSITITATTVDIQSTNPFVAPSDITQASATDGQVLAWSDSSSAWVPQTVSSAGGGDPDQNLWFQINGDTGFTQADSTTDILFVLGGTDISTTVSGDNLTIDFTGTIPTDINQLTDNSNLLSGGQPKTYAAITQIPVTGPDSLRYLMGDQYPGDNPTVYAISGTTIAFELDCSGHPFLIETSGGTLYNTGLVHVATDGTESTGSNAQGKVSGILYWQIPIGTTGNYAYQCSFHPAMRGTITIKDFTTI